MTGLIPILLSIAVLAGLLLAAVGVLALVRRHGDRRRALLLLLAGLVVLANVYLFSTAPTPQEVAR